MLVDCKKAALLGSLFYLQKDGMLKREEKIMLPALVFHVIDCCVALLYVLFLWEQGNQEGIVL